ncbi:MAG: DUF1559 domain-containing protein [Isosphaeraceae bacterium]
MLRRSRNGNRPGLSRAEVLMIVAIIGVVGMLLLLAMPAQRENARMLHCRNNLGQVGLAMLAYGNAFDGALPPVAAPLPSEPSPIASWLRALGEPDFSRLATNRPPRLSEDGPAAVPVRIPGLLCPGDPRATESVFDAPTSYRFNAGDSPGGLNGPFAPGVARTLREIELADGLGYTSAMSERLLGDGRADASPWNYRRLPAPIASESCPDDGDWKGDAGSSWATNGWVSGLYNHALAPNALRSCVGSDDRSALMGASSGHPENRVHVLLLDGGVRSYATTVNPQIWKALGTVGPRPGGPAEEP